MTIRESFYWLTSDIITMVWRNLLRITRVPQLIVLSIIQPIMFLLVFTYVFGGAIRIEGNGPYIDYLLPAILVQSVLFGSIQTGIGLADDLSHGIIDRFRSLPMARSAVLAGRTIADLVRNVCVILLMIGVGALLGFRFHGSIAEAGGMILLVLLFGFAFSWVSTAIGLAVKQPETAQVAGFIWIFPLVFASSAFVPIESMPAGLATFASVNPITVMINTCRGLAQGSVAFIDVLTAVTWIYWIAALAMGSAIALYRRT